MRHRAALAISAIMISLLLVGTVQGQEPDLRPGPSQPVREQNLDTNGHVAVHEQGIANVNVTNETLSIDGSVEIGNFPSNQDVTVSNFPSTQTVSVSNFPETQNVTVAANAPATTSFHEQFNLGCCADGYTATFSPMAVSLLTAEGTGSEEMVLCLVNDDVRVFCVGDAGNNLPSLVAIPLSQPVMADGVQMNCNNETEDCIVDVYVVGS